MALVIVETPGASNANSYETLDEANAYFEGRRALDPAFEDADSGEALLVMATRVLDTMSQAHRSLRKADGKCECAYYLTARKWTGAPASSTQRLAWPRTGMFDKNGNSLDFAITSISVAASAVVTTIRPHGKISTDVVFISGSNSTPSIDGARVVTVLSPTTFSIPIAVTVAGTAGNMTFIPQDLKDALSELAGQLNVADSTLDNDTRIQGITSVKAGSVAITFKDNIEAHVLPDAVLNLMAASWLTDELIEPAWGAEFELL